MQTMEQMVEMLSKRNEVLLEENQLLRKQFEESMRIIHKNSENCVEEKQNLQQRIEELERRLYGH